MLIPIFSNSPMSHHLTPMLISLSTALLSSSSLNYFLSASRKPSFRFFHLRFSSLSRTLPLFPRRHIHTLKVLAMAERSMKTTSHSHKHTNRLAAEHSPYLLQHAHNPVSKTPIFLSFVWLLRNDRTSKEILEFRMF